jgi:RNA polymerase sigma factor (sigma-70 family)
MSYMDAEMIVVQYDALCRRVAHKVATHTTHWHEFDDLLQEAYIALLEVNEKYDPSKGGFDGYAYYVLYFRLVDWVRKTSFRPRINSNSTRERVYYPPDSLDMLLEKEQSDDFSSVLPRRVTEDPSAEEAFEDVIDALFRAQVLEDFLEFYRETHPRNQGDTMDLLHAMAFGKYETLKDLMADGGYQEDRGYYMLMQVRKSAVSYRALRGA